MSKNSFNGVLVRRSGQTEFHIKAERVEAIIKSLSNGQVGAEQAGNGRRGQGQTFKTHMPEGIGNFSVDVPEELQTKFDLGARVLCTWYGLHRPPIVRDDGAHVNLSYLCVVGLGEGVKIPIMVPISKDDLELTGPLYAAAVRYIIQSFGREFRVEINVNEDE